MWDPTYGGSKKAVRVNYNKETGGIDPDAVFFFIENVRADRSW